MGHAVALARWIGSARRPVTPGRVLRKADVPAAGAALGLEVPARLRTMADIRDLNRPWCVAVATGLLEVGDGWVTAGPALEGWPPGDADLLAGWLAGLRAVCAAESYPQDEDSVRLLALALLTMLDEDGAPGAGGLWRPVFEALLVLCDRYGKHSWESLAAADQYGGPGNGKPLAGLVELLAGFGAVGNDPGRPTITPLGRWAGGHLAAGLAAPADPGLAAGEMIAEAARFGDEEQQEHVARTWLAGTSTRRQIVGPFARAVLAAWDNGPEPGEADGDWLGVEGAAAALEDKGPDEALSRVWESMPGADLDDRLAAVRATGHPDADALARAVAEFATSGALRSIDQVAQLKVSLTGFRPTIWRRVLVPATATFGDLHVVIQVLFGWDGDHLHVFEVGKKQYSDPFVNLEETGDEEAIRVRDAMVPGGTISYTYDLGTCWEHEITLEKTLTRDSRQEYPVCVAFRGDSPVEYWDEEEVEEPEPFGLNEVNRRLAALGREQA